MSRYRRKRKPNYLVPITSLCKPRRIVKWPTMVVVTNELHLFHLEWSGSTIGTRDCFRSIYSAPLTDRAGLCQWCHLQACGRVPRDWGLPNITPLCTLVTEVGTWKALRYGCIITIIQTSKAFQSRVRETFELNQLKSAPSQLPPVFSGFDRLQTCCHSFGLADIL